MKKIFLLIILSTFILACSSTEKVKNEDKTIKKVENNLKTDKLNKSEINKSKGFRDNKKNPRVEKGVANYSSFCDKNSIEKIISKHIKTIRYCYIIGLKYDKSLEGKMKLMWIIGIDGSLEKVEVVENSIQKFQDIRNKKRMNSCFKRQIKRMEFDIPKEGKCEVTYPFIFSLMKE